MAYNDIFTSSNQINANKSSVKAPKITTNNEPYISSNTTKNTQVKTQNTTKAYNEPYITKQNNVGQQNINAGKGITLNQGVEKIQQNTINSARKALDNWKVGNYSVYDVIEYNNNNEPQYIDFDSKIKEVEDNISRVKNRQNMEQKQMYGLGYSSTMSKEDQEELNALQKAKQELKNKKDYQDKYIATTNLNILTDKTRPDYNEDDAFSYAQLVASHDDSIAARVGKEVVKLPLEIAGSALGLYDALKDFTLDSAADSMMKKATTDFSNGKISQDQLDMFIDRAKQFKEFDAQSDNNLATQIRNLAARINQEQAYGDRYNLLTQAINSTFDFFTQYVLMGGTGALLSMSGQSGVNTYYDVMSKVDENGNPRYSQRQALGAATLHSLISWFTEGQQVERLNNILLGGATDQIVGSIIQNALSEGNEELIEDSLDKIADKVVLGEPIEYNFGDLANTYIVAAMSGAMMSIGGQVSFQIKSSTQANEIKEELKTLESFKPYATSEQLSLINEIEKVGNAALTKFELNSSNALTPITESKQTSPESKIETLKESMKPGLDDILDLDLKINDIARNVDTLATDFLAIKGVNMDADQYINLDEDTRENVMKLQEQGNKLGANLYFDSELEDNTGNVVDGYYNNKTDVMAVNPKGRRSAVSTIIHELVHRAKTSLGYNTLLEQTKAYYGEDYQNKYNQVAEAYKGLEGADIEEELVAITMQDLFGNEEYLDRLVKYNNSFAYRLLEGFKSLQGEDAPMINQMAYTLENAIADNQVRLDTERQAFANSKGATLTDQRDTEGNLLSNEQQEYFKDSKIRDSQGNLEVIYHTSKNLFTEFDPTNSKFYRFGNKTVNYYSNDKDVSGSYALGVKETVNKNTDYSVDKRIEKLKTQKEIVSKKYDENFDLANEGIDQFNYKYYGKFLKPYNGLRMYLLGGDIKNALANENVGIGKVLEKIMDTRRFASTEANFKQYVDLIDLFKSMNEKIKESNYNITDNFGKEFANDLQNFENIFNDALSDIQKTNHYITLRNSNSAEYDNIKQKIEDLTKNYQYKGYGNALNPYYINGEYTDYSDDVRGAGENVLWNKLQNSNDGKTEIEYFESLDGYDELTDYLFEEDREGRSKEEIAYDILDHAKHTEGLGELYDYMISSPICLANCVNYAAEGVYNYEDDYYLTTNDIVHSVLGINEFLGEEYYDGVVFDGIRDFAAKTEGSIKPSKVVALFNSNQFKNIDNLNPTESQDIRYSFGTELGLNNLKDYVDNNPNSKLAKDYKEMQSNYDLAVKMQRQGKSAEEIFNKTHWFYDKKYGKLVNEFYDDGSIDKMVEYVHNAKTIKSRYTVGHIDTEKTPTIKDVLGEDNLFLTMYPSMANCYIAVIDNRNKDTSKLGGWNTSRYTDDRGIIQQVLQIFKYDDFGQPLSKNSLRTTIAHEFQHGIQNSNNPILRDMQNARSKRSSWDYGRGNLRYIEEEAIRAGESQINKDLRNTEYVFKHGDLTNLKDNLTYHNISENLRYGTYIEKSYPLLAYANNYLNSHNLESKNGIKDILNSMISKVENSYNLKGDYGYKVISKDSMRRYLNDAFDYANDITNKGTGEIVSNSQLRNIFIDLGLGYMGYDFAENNDNIDSEGNINYERTNEIQTTKAKGQGELSKDSQKGEGQNPNNPGLDVDKYLKNIKEYATKKYNQGDVEEALQEKINEEEAAGFIPGQEQAEIEQGRKNEKIRNADIEKINKDFQKDKKFESENTKKILKEVGYKIKQYAINGGEEISRIAKATNNAQLEADYDMLKRASSITQNLLADGRFDSNGKKIGKSFKEIWKPIQDSGKSVEFQRYMYNLLNVDSMKQGKPVFDESITSEMSSRTASELELTNPEFKEWAKEIYDFNNANRDYMVQKGLISKATADLWAKMYPHYVPISRVMLEETDLSNKPDIASANKGSLDKRVGSDMQLQPLDYAIAKKTEQIIRSGLFNDFAKEYQRTTKAESQKFDINYAIDDEIQGTQYDEKSKNANMVMYLNGDAYVMPISQKVFDSVNNKPSVLDAKIPVISQLSSLRTNLITGYNPVFWITNGIKDIQDVFANSKHLKDFAALYPKAWRDVVSNADTFKLYKSLGGQASSYFAQEGKQFKGENLLQKGANAILGLNEMIETLPRYTEFLASLKNNETLEQAMLNSAEITTNFKRGGKFTKFLNRNGFNFLNASVQGADKIVRNWKNAYDTKGMKGVLKYGAKLSLAYGIPLIILNGLIWRKDKDYEELSDYVKENYYIVGKYGDGKFIRIPKGRLANSYQSIMTNTLDSGKAITQGDWDRVLDNLIATGKNIIDNVAPNNPLDNNIISPFVQVAQNKNWYGEELVPQRLKNEIPSEQYDETTTSIATGISKFLKKLNIETSPYKINYLMDQYSGGLGDIVMPMFTLKAETGLDDGTIKGKLASALLSVGVDKFTTDSIVKNQNVSDFYVMKEELYQKAQASSAPDEIILASKYMNSVNSQMSKLYAEKRQVQLDKELTDKEKYDKARDIQDLINKLAGAALDGYDDIDMSQNYASINGIEYYKSNGEYAKVSAKDLEITKDYSTEQKGSYFAAKEQIKGVNTKKEKTEIISGTDLTYEMKNDIYSSISNTQYDKVIDENPNLTEEEKYKLKTEKSTKSQENKDLYKEMGIYDNMISYMKAKNLQPKDIGLSKSTVNDSSTSRKTSATTTESIDKYIAKLLKGSTGTGAISTLNSILKKSKRSNSSNAFKTAAANIKKIQSNIPKKTSV